MRVDREALGKLLARRLNILAAYLCGPFDAAGEPCSEDVHILAVTDGGAGRDLHLVPDVAGVARRIEISAVPLADLKRAVEGGVTSWPAFYLLNKARNCVPLARSGEPPELEVLRHRARSASRIKPSFYASAMRDYAALAAGQDRGSAGPWGIMRANAALLAALALNAILAGRTFSKNSDLVAGAGALRPIGRPRGLASGSEPHSPLANPSSASLSGGAPQTVSPVGRVVPTEGAYRRGDPGDAAGGPQRGEADLAGMLGAAWEVIAAVLGAQDISFERLVARPGPRRPASKEGDDDNA